MDRPCSGSLHSVGLLVENPIRPRSSLDLLEATCRTPPGPISAYFLCADTLRESKPASRSADRPSQAPDRSNRQSIDEPVPSLQCSAPSEPDHSNDPPAPPTPPAKSYVTALPQLGAGQKDQGRKAGQPKMAARLFAHVSPRAKQLALAVLARSRSQKILQIQSATLQMRRLEAGMPGASGAVDSFPQRRTLEALDQDRTWQTQIP